MKHEIPQTLMIYVHILLKYIAQIFLRFYGTKKIPKNGYNFTLPIPKQTRVLYKSRTESKQTAVLYMSRTESDYASGCLDACIISTGKMVLMVYNYQ